MECRRFENKVAIVTGAASGIGLATASALVREGARVAIADRDGEKAERVAATMPKDSAIGVLCDVTDEAAVEACVARTIRDLGGFDVLVNNAGVMVFKPLDAQTREDWLRVLTVDLLGAFFFTRAAFRCMKKGGAIVNVSSIHAIETTPLVAPYAASKAALVSLTRSASLEGKPKGIRVNAVLVGAVDTPMLWHNPNIVSGVEVVDRKTVGKPEEIAATILFLASDEASYVQGEAMRADGGRLDRLV